MTALAISGSPSRQSKSRRLLAHAVERLAGDGIEAGILDLCDIPAGDLLGRTRGDAIDRALASAGSARLLIVGTPVYRASYSGLLKVFFDLFPRTRSPAPLRFRSRRPAVPRMPWSSITRCGPCSPAWAPSSSPPACM